MASRISLSRRWICENPPPRLALPLPLMKNQNSKYTEINANRPQPKSPFFDHERLQVYRLQLEFIKWVTPLIEEAMNSATSRPREVCDQLDRASISAVLNTAEGNGKRQRQIRARFFDDARGSATECAGCLDVLVAKGILASDRVLDGKALLLQIVCMMSGLVERFDQESGKFQEGVVPYRISNPQSKNSTKRQTQRKSRKLLWIP
jgi:four helix bundle protein